eukprot:TRINITY_DN7462_c0_g1_i1.p1 TRINITY_DN7462_c0_g1~~TRINITY_DN7462_c0_g1_i1.p1  ORF type:complete len:149 (+),score=49.55 TRINITY_DN7462_c0_g1_i1:96-542(+)
MATFCKCNIVAKTGVTQSGDNIGKAYICCSKPRAQSCKFFHFLDENGQIVENKPKVAAVPSLKRPVTSPADESQPKKAKVSPEVEQIVQDRSREMLLDMIAGRLDSQEKRIQALESNESVLRVLKLMAKKLDIKEIAATESSDTEEDR